MTTSRDMKIAEAVSVPDGWKLVPVDSEWFLNFIMEWSQFKHMGRKWAQGFYRAMLADAPQAEQSAQALTNEDIDKVKAAFKGEFWLTDDEFRKIARAIEAKLKGGA